MFTFSGALVSAGKATLFAVLMMPVIASEQAVVSAQTTAEAAPTVPAILNRDQASAILPATVFFHGQSASIQGRNSAGVKTGGKLILATLVDTSGYSSAVQQTYQAYLLTEVPLNFGAKRLAPGAYGFGFVNGSEMIVMDIGGSELLRVKIDKDQALIRPNPLQILKGSTGEGFRLYLGRNYVVFSPADK